MEQESCCGLFIPNKGKKELKNVRIHIYNFYSPKKIHAIKKWNNDKTAWLTKTNTRHNTGKIYLGNNSNKKTICKNIYIYI